jgi:mannose-6-phosphate isomerase-like protein (cupin superfamily)
MSQHTQYPVSHVLITRQNAEKDAEIIGQKNKLGESNNNGRKVFATSIMHKFGEAHIREPLWKAPSVIPTGKGGLELATFTEYSCQDRHKHQRGIEIYTVLKGIMKIYINDTGPHLLHAGDEIVILPGTIHEVIQQKQGDREKESAFELIVRVHSVYCHGAEDKYVQLKSDGQWLKWSDLSKAQRFSAYKQQK